MTTGAMTPTEPPYGDELELGTPPSVRRLSGAKAQSLGLELELELPAVERSAASASYASSANSNVLSPRYNSGKGSGASNQATVVLEDEVGTPKTPEGDEAAAQAGYFLPQLSTAQPPAQRQLHSLPARSPGSGSKSGTGTGFQRSHTYVKQLSRESARELAKTALSMRATSIGEFTFDNPRESVRENIRRVQVRGFEG